MGRKEPDKLLEQKRAQWGAGGGGRGRVLGKVGRVSECQLKQDLGLLNTKESHGIILCRGVAF